MTIPRSRIHFVPPPQPHKPAPRDVFQVVEIGRQEEHGDDEDEHEAGGEEPEAEEVYQQGCWEDESVSQKALRAGLDGCTRKGLTGAEAEKEK